MNEYTKEELINYRLARAKETLNEANDLLKLGYYNTVVNRLYYAAFYAAIALMLHNEIKTTTHTGVRRMLGQHFVSTGKISRESGKLYTELFNKRQRSDYNDFYDFGKEDVAQLIEPAEILVTEIKALIVVV